MPSFSQITLHDAHFCRVSLERKLTDTGVTRRDFVCIHHIIWREAGREIPPGHALVFKDGNKWKFADDRGSLFASILDDAFLARVRDGEERFGCGDRLLVSLRTRQSQTATGYKAEREILAVREHREPMRQHEIFSPH